MAVATESAGDTRIAAAETQVLLSVRPGAARDRIAAALSQRSQQVSLALAGASQEPDGAELDPGAVIVVVCDVDAPRELASLRRLRRSCAETAIVAISPEATGTGVRRALDAGADAVVFEPELESTLVLAVRAVASGQSVVPRKLRATVERPAFSHRERQVLSFLVQGLTNAEIADHLYLSESTIKSHLASVFTKLGVRSRKEAAVLFREIERGAGNGAAA